MKKPLSPRQLAIRSFLHRPVAVAGPRSSSCSLQWLFLVPVISPWLAVFSVLAIFLCVLSFNLVGDGLGDALDPRGRQ